MPRPKYLSFEEIEKIIQEWPDSSEDDLNGDEDDEMLLQQDDWHTQANGHENNNFVVEELDIRNVPVVLASEIDLEGGIVFENMELDQENEYGESRIKIHQPNEGNEVKQLRERFKKLIWKNVPLNLSGLDDFNGDTQLPQKILSCETPLSMFNLYFDDEVLDLIMEQSNLYSSQKNISNPFVVKKDDYKQISGSLCSFFNSSTAKLRALLEFPSRQ